MKKSIFSGKTHCTEVSFDKKNSDTRKEAFLYVATCSYSLFSSTKNRVRFRKFRNFRSGGKLIKCLHSRFSNFWPFSILPVFEEKTTKVVKVHQCFVAFCLISNILSLRMGLSVSLDISYFYSTSCYVDPLLHNFKINDKVGKIFCENIIL